MSLTITYLGHSGVLISDGAHTLCIDPFLTGYPHAKHQPADIKATHVAFTHGHADHFNDDGIAIAKANNAHVMAPFEVANACIKKGIDADRVSHCNPGGKADTDFGYVAFTPAIHSSSDAEGNYMGVACGLSIHFGGIVIYHAGDTALFSDMKLIGEVAHPSIAFLPIGGAFTMTPELASHAAEMVKPKIAVPIHYKTMPSQVQHADDFKPAGVEVKVMEPGEVWTYGE